MGQAGGTPIKGQVGHAPHERSSLLTPSSEYLKKYLPKNSIANNQKYVAKDAELIHENIKKQRARKHKRVKIAQEKARKTRGNRSKSQRVGSGEYGIHHEGETRKRI